MERREGPQTPFEVYCYHCHVTFAAGTRRCVHCGARLGGRPGPPELFAPPGAGGAPGPGGAPGAGGDLAEDAPELSLGRRLGGTSLWVLLALGAVLVRMCAER